MVRPCFFFRAPDIAPRTLCVCQSSDLLICSTVAPSGRRSIASSWASLVLDLDAACLRVFALVVGASVEPFLFLLIMDSFWPASLPAPHAFASEAHTFKSKRRSCHCYLRGPSAIPWLTKEAQTGLGGPLSPFARRRRE